MPQRSSRPRAVARGLAAIAMVATTLALAPIDLAEAAPVTLDGTVFRDHNQDGARDAATDPGVEGIDVRAVDQNGATAGNATSGSDGSYSISLDDSNEYRVEFSIPAALDFLEPGPLGSDNGGDVQFVRAGGSFSGIDFGVANPSDFCQDNPDLATPCYVYGSVAGSNGGNAAQPTFVIFDSTDDGDLGPHVEVPFSEIGTVWGVADDPDGGWFTSAYVKRHSGLTAAGTGAIFSVAPDGTSSLFTTIPDTGADPHPANNASADAWLLDSATWDAVGKMGLGDIDVSDDGSTLFAMNLNNRSVYPVSLPAGAVGTPVAAPVAPNCAAADSRPFGLAADDGDLHAGVVCSLQSTNGTGTLAAYVFSRAQDLSGSWTLELTIPLDGASYPRKCADAFGNNTGEHNANGSDGANDPGGFCAGNANTVFNANWREWMPVAPPTTFGDGADGISGNFVDSPRFSSPMLTDLDFDHAGDLVLGLRSRFGDQVGNGTPAPGDNNISPLVRGISLGDMLKACRDTNGNLVLESNGSCGGVSSGGVGSQEGPGGGEYFNGDDHWYHDQTGNGGVYTSKVSTEIANTMFDPFPGQGETYDGGVTYHDTDSGNRTRELRIFNGNAGNLNTAGKANGLGDLEADCDSAPVEIGDYVWFDADGDGVQGPAEPGLENVTVRLLDAGGTQVGAPVTTDSNGRYVFAIDPATTYTLRFDPSTAINIPGGFAVGDLDLSPQDTVDPNALEADAVDSDATEVLGNFDVPVAAHAAGENDHTYDVGFFADPPLRIGNLVWLDLNDNGIVDPGEPGVPDGVQVQLFLDNGNNTFEPGTDTSQDFTATSGGNYWFTDLAEGTYFVAIPAGQGQLAGHRPSSVDFAGDGDNNNNGTAQGGFASVSDPVALSVDGEPQNEVAVGGADDEAAANAATTDHDDDDSNLTVDLGFFEPFAIGNQVWNDVNDDGIRQPATEPVLNGVVVNLLNGLGNPVPGVPPTSTAGQGLYVFDNLPAGSYIVEIAASNFTGVLSGFESSSPPQGIDDGTDNNDNGAPVGSAVRSTVIVLGDGPEPTAEVPTSPTGAIDANADLTVDFGFNQRAGYGDRVWFDTDRDGLQGAGEPGVNGVTVELFKVEGGGDVSQGTQVTAGDGDYFFANLMPGDYYAVFTLPSGATFTTQDANANANDSTDSDADPTNGGTATTTLDPSELDDTWDAGIFVDASIDLEKQILDPDGNAGTESDWYNADTLDGETPLDDRFVAHIENGTATYRFVVTNTGPADLGNVVVTDDTLSCSPVAVGALANGASATVGTPGCTFSPLTGSLVNTATATGTPVDGTGTPISQNLGLPPGSLDVSHVDTAAADIIVPSISITKTAAVQVITPTTPSVDFTLEVQNTSTNVPELVNVAVIDPDCVGGPVFTGGDADTDDALDVGEVWTYDCTVDQPGGGWGATYTNVADVTGDVPATDPDGYPLPDSPPVTDQGEDTVGVADIVITKQVREQQQNAGQSGGPGPYQPAETVRTGEGVDWQVVVTNTGGVALASPSITESECSGVTIADAIISGSDTDGTTTLEAGETWTFDCSTGSVDSAITNTAGFTGTPVGTSTPVTVEASASVTPIEPHMSVLLEIFNPFIGTFVDADSDGPTEGGEGPPVVISSGDDVTYRVTVYNIDSTGAVGDNLALSDVSVLLEIPGEADQTLTLPALAPGASFTFTDVVVTNVTTSGIATATVSADGSNRGGEQFGPVDSNDGDQDANDVDDAGTLLADLVVKKYVNTSTIPDFVDAQDGQIAPTTLLNTAIDYRVTLTNTGEVPLGNVAADDAIADCALALVDDGNGDAILDVDETWTYECNDADGQTSGDMFRNVATGAGTPVDGAGAPNGQPVNDSDEANVDLIAPASLGDRVWLDRVRDGQQDPDTASEPGVVGLTVNLRAPDNTLLDSTVTGPNGFYEFTNLFPGSYIVEVIVPPIYDITDQNQGDDATDSDIDGSGRTGVIVLTEGQNDPTNDAGLYLPASIGDFIWADTNANGVQDAGEVGIPNVLVQLKDQNGLIIDTQFTGPNGDYLFVDLDAGTYSIGIVPPVGFVVSPQNVGNDATDSDIDPTTLMTAPTDLAEGEVDLTLDGGLYEPASLGDFVWNDENRDGIQDGGELPVEGIVVNLLDGSGVPVPGVAPTATDNTGFYEFTGLVPGDYIVEFVIPIEYAISPQDVGNDATDSDIDDLGRTGVITLSSGENDPTNDAGIYLTSRLGDLVFEDLNGNGIQDPGEPGVDGATVELLDSAMNPIPGIDPIVTGPDGLYLFDDLVAGDYFVRVTPPAGFVITQQNVGDDAADSDIDPAAGPNQGKTGLISLGENVTDLTNDAGLYRPASLGNFVWDDLNGNGVQDAGEPGIDGVTVQLKNASGDVIDTTTTMLGGFYGFADLVPGTYSIGIIPPAGYVVTPANRGDDTLDSDIDPITLMSGPVVLASGDENLTLDAGVYLPATIGDRVWRDDNRNGIQDGGELGIGGVTVQLLDGNGDEVGQTTTDTDGLYLFTGLVPGTYTVVVVPGPNFVISPRNAGADDALDSDADPVSGVLDETTLTSGEDDRTHDAGITPRTLDLTIDKSVESQSSSEVVWSIVVTNLGPDDDPGPLTVTDNVPASITPTAASGEGWTCTISGQVVTCVSDEGLAAGASLAPILLTTTAPPADVTVTNDATVESTVLEATVTNNSDVAAVTGVAPPPPTTNIGPVALPRTGADALRWTGVGAMLLLIGAAVAGVGRDRRRRFDQF